MSKCLVCLSVRCNPHASCVFDTHLRSPFSHLVDFVLINDAVSFVFVCVKFVDFPESITVLVMAQYIVGALMLPLNYWAKVGLCFVTLVFRRGMLSVITSPG